MNTTYRAVFNESLGTWVAVSEIAKSHGKRSSVRKA
ncbi:ESPR domain-containing protein, partial [Cupriavidus sp.]